MGTKTACLVRTFGKSATYHERPARHWSPTRWRARAVALLVLAWPLLGHAASFDCAKAASSAEKAICSNGSLSKLDNDLSLAWRKASRRGSDAAALKVTQQRWLKVRDACGDDDGCLGDRYRERLASLNGTPLMPNRWDRTWSLDSNNRNVSGTLTFIGTAPHLHFALIGYNGSHDGWYEGDLVLKGEEASYNSADGCRLYFVRNRERIRVENRGAPSRCGEPMGVSYEGDYIAFTQFTEKPKSSLLSLKVVDTTKQDAAAHALLDEDYQALVDTVNIGVIEGADADHLGANVRTFFVRGLRLTNASIVMRHNEQLWVGLLVGDEDDRTRMRYYTNVPTWKRSVPKTIRAWHEDIDMNLPVDLMP